MDPSAMLFSSLVPFILVGIMLIGGITIALTPYLMPKRECFAVTVPDQAQSDPQLRAYKRRYAFIVTLLTLFIVAACICAFAYEAFSLGVAFMGFGILGVCLISYGLMFYFRTKVRSLKRERGWESEKDVSVALVGEGPSAGALSLKWDLLFLPLIFASLAICFLGYGDIPEQIPNRLGFDGEVTSTISKSPLAACFPALVVVFLDAILCFAHWQILRSKKFSDPSIPAASAWAYGRFAHAQSMLIVVSGIVIGFVGLAMALSFIGAISIGLAAAWCLVCVLAVASGSLGVTLVYGQNGSRLIAQVSSGQMLLRDNDRFWKLGIFYVNRDDPSLFLPERFGVGWTMNWGRPAAWAILFALVAFIVIFVVVVLFLVGTRL